MNCLTTIEGIYQFSYEVGGTQSLGGICDNSKNRIEACQNPGATSVDNTLFSMNYAKCKDVSTSSDQGMYLYMYLVCHESDTVFKNKHIYQMKCLQHVSGITFIRYPQNQNNLRFWQQ